jgi:1-acyl-sn-glycerol-3-phosphate acyltransferase
VSNATDRSEGAPRDGREPGRGALAHAVARVRALLFLGSTFAAILAVGFWLVPLAAWLSKPGWLKAPCRVWTRILFPLFGMRVVVHHPDRLHDPRARLFIANHQSFLDIMVMMGWVRWPSFLAKKEIQSWPWFGWAMNVLRCVFVDRADRESRNATGAAVKASMSHGVDFCIFAEGTRSRDGELLPFRPGGFQIGIDSGALITPVVIDPTWRILNKKGFRMWPRTIHVSILPPIDAGLLKSTDRKTLAREVEDAIRTELLRLRSLA